MSTNRKPKKTLTNSINPRGMSLELQGVLDDVDHDGKFDKVSVQTLRRVSTNLLDVNDKLDKVEKLLEVGDVMGAQATLRALTKRTV